MATNDAGERAQISGRVIRGHGVASGQGPDTPYPYGSIGLQMPVFAALGLDLSGYYAATINVDISPRKFRMRNPSLTLRNVRWTDLHPPENFSFSPCRLMVGRTKVEGLIYFPHPETKERHFQSDTTLEVLAPFVDGLTPGTTISLEIHSREVEII